MTNDEFREFMRQLQASFPSLYEWLAGLECSRETQGVWRTALKRYSLDEVSSVIERWSTGQLGAFAWYDRDKVHLLIRAVIEGDRSKASKADRESTDREYWRDESRRRNRTGSFADGLAETLSHAGKDVAKAFKELHPVWGKVQTGEISREAYEERKRAVFASRLEAPHGETWVG